MGLRVFLENHNIEYRKMDSVARLSFVGIGGRVKVAAYPKNRGELLCLLAYLSSHSIPHKVVGNMSNILPPDEDWEICLVCTRRIRAVYFEKEGTVAECGLPLSSLCKAMLTEQRVPPVELFGIPGTIGGAVYQNAGAFDLSVSDRIVWVDFYDPRIDSVVKKMRSELDFSYRRSSVASEGYVLSACIAEGTGSAPEATEKMNALYHRRRKAQPDAPSLGSVFLRVGDTSAAYDIDKAGLKGRRIGDAAVSEKHAGFIINVGAATASDYLALVRLVKETVYDRFGVRLQTEIEIIEEKEKKLWLHFA